MEIEFSFHALQRMKERSINKKEIIESLNNPQKTAKKSSS